MFRSVLNPTRFLNRRSLTSFTVKFDEFGDPQKVLRSENCEVPRVTENTVLLKVLAAPINPADINYIEGTYGLKPELPDANAGLEGVGEIVEVGSGVKSHKVGDRVLLPGSPWGTWRQYGVAPVDELRKLSSQMNLAMACTMRVNPPTAYRMLKDFVQLKAGDTVIQNGANSGVGQAVIQLARAMDLKTVNIVRDRPNIDSLKDQLKIMGADYVVTEEELRRPEMKKIFTNVPTPKLALNCVGGQNCTDMMRHVANGAYVVTYGAMSRKPVMASATALIFKDVKVVGFWRSKWQKLYEGSVQDDEMYADLERYALEGQLLPPMHTFHKLEDYKEAVNSSVESFISSKQILVNN